MPSSASILDTRAGRVTTAMCCLLAIYGVAMPFLSRWLEVERGLAGAQIGLLLSLAQLARIVTGPAIALWADSAGDRRTPVRLLALLTAVSYACFFAIDAGFTVLLLFGFLALTFSQALAPFLEGAALRACESGRLPYGIARGIGSSSFIIASVAGGALIARFGAGAVAIWIIAATLIMVVAAWTRLEPDPPPPHIGEKRPGLLDGARDLIGHRRYLVVVVGCGLIQGAHAFYYGFSVLDWRDQGVSAAVIGQLWGVAVAGEVAFLWSLPRIEPRVRPEALILIGAAGAVVRWTCLGFAPPVSLLWPIQSLHALSFAAAHVGAMRLIFRETPERAAGLAQTLYAAFASGLVLGLCTLASGPLYDRLGSGGYWVMAGLAGTGGLVSLLLLRLKPARNSGGRDV